MFFGFEVTAPNGSVAISLWRMEGGGWRWGEKGRGLAPARLIQVQFALNRKHVSFFMLYLKTTDLESSSFHHFYVERQYQKISFYF